MLLGQIRTGSDDKVWLGMCLGCRADWIALTPRVKIMLTITLTQVTLMWMLGEGGGGGRGTKERLMRD